MKTKDIKLNSGLVLSQFPQETFDVISIDPPWKYDDPAEAGNRGAGCKYDVMTFEDIKEMPIQDIAKPDAVLLMWVTMPFLQEALDLGKHWGFTYNTGGFVWVKRSPKFWQNLLPKLGSFLIKHVGKILIRNNKAFNVVPADELGQMIDTQWEVGMGHSTRSNAELVLLFKRGKGVARQDAGVRQVIASQVRENSRKPDEYIDRVNKLYGSNVSKVELFARQHWAGWYCWGNEVGKFDAKQEDDLNL